MGHISIWNRDKTYTRGIKYNVRGEGCEKNRTLCRGCRLLQAHKSTEYVCTTPISRTRTIALYTYTVWLINNIPIITAAHVYTSEILHCESTQLYTPLDLLYKYIYNLLIAVAKHIIYIYIYVIWLLNKLIIYGLKTNDILRYSR